MVTGTGKYTVRYGSLPVFEPLNTSNEPYSTGTKNGKSRYRKYIYINTSYVTLTITNFPHKNPQIKKKKKKKEKKTHQFHPIQQQAAAHQSD
ncbi:hypothetical protein Hanom_Chr15g01349641 [Helianthus anomalus]